MLTDGGGDYRAGGCGSCGAIAKLAQRAERRCACHPAGLGDAGDWRNDRDSGRGTAGANAGAGGGSAGVSRAYIRDAADAPAVQVAGAATIADFTDKTALAGFADSVDVITFEFENIPIEALDFLESQKPILPNRRALAVSQDRLAEKDFLRGLGWRLRPITRWIMRGIWRRLWRRLVCPVF